MRIGSLTAMTKSRLRDRDRASVRAPAETLATGDCILEFVSNPWNFYRVAVSTSTGGYSAGFRGASLLWAKWSVWNT